MEWRTATGILAGTITLGATIPYIVAAARRTIRPSPLAWGGGALISSIAFTAQMSAEPSWSAVIAGTAAGYCSLIAVLALRNAAVRLTRKDGVCGVLGLVAIVAWQVTDSPELAIALAIAADAVVCIPMILQAARDPFSELPSRFLVAGIGAVFGLVSAAELDFVSLAWPAFSVFLNFLVGGLALTGQRRSTVLSGST